MMMKHSPYFCRHTFVVAPVHKVTVIISTTVTRLRIRSLSRFMQASIPELPIMKKKRVIFNIDIIPQLPTTRITFWSGGPIRTLGSELPVL